MRQSGIPFPAVAARSTNPNSPNGAALFEAANKLRGSVESAEYKHLVLGLIFLKYISDAFEQRCAELELELSDPKSKEYVKDPTARAEELEDRDAYSEKHVFWVPTQARWPADPKLAAIASDLVESIREDLAIDWADRESTEAAIRRKIKRLLRHHEYTPPAQSVRDTGGEEPRDLNHYTQLVLEQAKALYRYWPEVEGQLFEYEPG